MKRVRSAMPKSAFKQDSVVKILAKICGIKVIDQSGVFIREEHIKNVVHFFNSDDISRPDPGKKTAWICGNYGWETHGFTITKTFHLFKDQHPKVDIGRSKYTQLPPTQVNIYSRIHYNACVCRHHELSKIYELLFLNTYLALKHLFHSA